MRTQTITRKSDNAEKPSATTKEAVSFFRALKFKRANNAIVKVYDWRILLSSWNITGDFKSRSINYISM